MTLAPLIGHQKNREQLARAIRTGRLPQVLLMSGPAGVGKQRLALWLAQMLLCQSRTDEPCGSCRPCRLVAGLSHPDVHWLVPISRPKASDPEKQIDEASQAMASIIDERRSDPLYGPVDGMAIHGMASVRLLQRQASLTSVEGGPRVFIIGEADRLVSQEASPEAANALLKLLEEPPPGSVFVLTTVEPRRLLPTMLSRAVPLRLGRLTDAEVTEFLKVYRPQLASRELTSRVAQAEGSIGWALGGGDESDKALQAAHQWLEAVLSGPGSSLERSLKQAPWAARGEFTAMLDAVSDTLGQAARGTLGQPLRRPVPQALLRYQSPGPLLQAMEHVADAREAAWGNMNPQILLAVLGEELAEVL